MKLLSSRYVLTAGAVAGLFVVANKAVGAAADFSSEFRNIQNLNLGKNINEMEAYKKTIKQTAFDTGKNLIDTTKAFYDVQSATGLFGDDVANLVDKVAKFSTATGKRKTRKIACSSNGNNRKK